MSSLHLQYLEQSRSSSRTLRVARRRRHALVASFHLRVGRPGTTWLEKATPSRGCCAPTPTQRGIPAGSASEYQWHLGSKRVYRATWSRSFGWCVNEGYWNVDLCCPMCPWGSGRTLLFTYFYFGGQRRCSNA